MSDRDTTTGHAAPLPSVGATEDSASAAAAFARLARAPSTLRGYAADWRDFLTWCRATGHDSLPASPTTVGHYLAAQADRLKPGTLDRRLSAIIVHHRQAGWMLDRRHPAISDVMAGVRRVYGSRPDQKIPILTEQLRDLIAVQPNTLTGIRNRAVLALTWASAARRSEIAALQVADVAFTSEGILLQFCHGKRDAAGRGWRRGVPFGQEPASSPPHLLRAWMLAARLGPGPLFRRIDAAGNLSDRPLSGEAIAAIVKGAIRLAGPRWGLTRSETDELVKSTGGHSLRSGFITSAVLGGAHPLAIAQQSGHRRIGQLLDYYRRIDPLAGDAVRHTGL